MRILRPLVWCGGWVRWDFLRQRYKASIPAVATHAYNRRVGNRSMCVYFYLVVLTHAVEALPKVGVFNRLLFAKSFPTPVVLFPLHQTKTQSLHHVTAGSDQSHPRGLFQL